MLVEAETQDTMVGADQGTHPLECLVLKIACPFCLIIFDLLPQLTRFKVNEWLINYIVWYPWKKNINNQVNKNLSLRQLQAIQESL